MSTRLSNYVKAYRKRCGLTQEQLSFILGCKTGAKVSRYERLSREPALRAAFALEVALSTPVQELFAGVFDEVKEATEERARLLALELDPEPAGKSKPAGAPRPPRLAP